MEEKSNKVGGSEKLRKEQERKSEKSSSLPPRPPGVHRGKTLSIYIK